MRNKINSLPLVGRAREGVVLAFIFFLCGCQSAPQKTQESPKETVSAISTVTQGLTNKPVTDAQLQNLGRQVSHDPQAQSALRSINSALGATHTVKYCPENGQRFSAQMEWCPDHKAKLEWVD